MTPGAKRPGVVGSHGESWRLRVAQPPARGAADEGVLQLPASVLRIDRRAVRLVSGHAARDKILELTGLTQAEIEARLGAADRKDE